MLEEETLAAAIADASPRQSSAPDKLALIGLSCVGHPNLDDLVRDLRCRFAHEALVLKWHDVCDCVAPIVEAATGAGLFTIFVSGAAGVSWQVDLIVDMGSDVSVAKCALDVRAGVLALEEYRKRPKSRPPAPTMSPASPLNK